MLGTGGVASPVPLGEVTVGLGGGLMSSCKALWEREGGICIVALQVRSTKEREMNLLNEPSKFAVVGHFSFECVNSSLLNETNVTPSEVEEEEEEEEEGEEEEEEEGES